MDLIRYTKNFQFHAGSKRQKHYIAQENRVCLYFDTFVLYEVRMTFQVGE